jgi:TonB-dependent SusC/RagA subfamily outer membrane receptor
MKRFTLITLLLLSVTAYSQQNLKHIRTRSWQTYIYKISAADAEQFIKWDSIPVSRYTDTEPFVMALADSIDTDSLPVGHYVEIRVIENEVQAWLFNNTSLHVLTINNKNNLQLDVRTKTGELQTRVTAFLKGKPVPYNNSSKTFWVKQHKLDEAVVKICTPGDTTFIELADKDDQYRILGEQRRQNYHYTKIYKILNWLPLKIKRWITHSYKYKSSRIGAQGYIIFNQPKYKPLDTVKFKGYAVDKKWRQYNKTVQVYLAYYNKGESINKLIKTLQPVSDGAFTGEFVLADTIPSDISCTLYFKTVKGKEIIRNTFKIEDYLLDEMGSFSFTANKETVYRNDSIHFTAAAKDANSLHVMDATATLVITATAINKFFKDTVYVADTLYYEEKKLLTTADTKFSFYTKNLPAADISLTAKLIFKTSNNELHEETETFNYAYETSNIIITQQADSIKAVLMINGVAVAATGEIEMNDEPARKIQFPYTAKMDPVAAEYTFYYKDENNKLTLEIFEIEENYRLDFNRTSRNDTAGFIISNAYKIPVYYTVFFGKEIISTGKSSNAVIEWQHKMKNYRRAYKVRWQYIWAGEEKAGEETIGLFYKLLDIKINTSDKIFPGQKDTVKVLVKDYMGRPAENVNLAAVSYNNQFNKDIRVPQPPYLARYKGRKYLLREGFENDGDYFISKKYLLGKNKKWVDKFHLDSMLYYKLLFPANGYYDAVTLIDNVLPQLSINMVQNGVPQEIYILYINRQMVYYNGVTDKMTYSFETMPESVQLRIRLKDKIIEVDSLYMQPHYKHDISIDINNLPPHSKIITAEKWWSYSEMNLLENSIWQMKDDYSNNNAYLWQYNRVVKLSGNRKHIAGPFLPNNTLIFFNPASFDINFPFEPGYEYSFSKQISRLEKMQLFPRKDINNYLPDYAAALKLGDTIAEPPAIKFATPKVQPFLKTSTDVYIHQYYASRTSGRGRLQFTLPKDTSIKYIVLQPQNGNPLILGNDYSYGNKVNNLLPGTYSFYAVTESFYTAQKSIVIKKDETLCIKTDTTDFKSINSFITALVNEAIEPIEPFIPAKADTIQKESIVSNEAVFVEKGGAAVSGKVIDKKGGSPVAFASVRVKGTNKAVGCDANGNFSLAGLRNGSYTLIIAAVGYMTMEQKVTVEEAKTVTVNVQLQVASKALNEVVVIGYGTARKMSLTGSIATISSKEISFDNALQGKVAGVNIVAANGFYADSTRILIRGASSIGSNSKPIYVVDGIIYEEMPGIAPEMIDEMNVIQDAAATAVYGARGANGVVVITTKTKTQRTIFRDYAFWKPNFFTNKNGEAAFEVQYPDNITGWRTFVVGMDKKRRGGKASILTQSFKSITAQLALPQFLLEGDTATILGKAKNYTADAYTYNSQFTVNGKEAASNNKTVNGNEALVDELAVSTGSDTLTVNYHLQTTTGFKDGEQKKIPVFKKGTEETVGSFWVLQKDTTVHYKASAAAKEITLYAQNNTLDVLLDEIEHLKKYPYYCMEQTASKLTGYAMEKKIKQQLQQPFANEKEMNRLLVKLQKTQQFDGGWPWWESGKSNFYISNYVANTLLAFRETPLVETNVRNAFLYLQNQLPYLKRNELLAALVTLNNGKHAMNYEEWMSRIYYDSLNQHQQWQWVKIMQGQNLEHTQQLQKLLQQQMGTMLGGVHWGEDSYSWYSNSIATTVLAFEVLKNEPGYEYMLPKIIQYFLERRKTGYWRNTVESATILNAVLPTILQQQANFNEKAVLNISGDTVMQVSQYPYQLKLKNTAIKNLQVTKTGGGMVYFTAYEKQFNPLPLPVDSNFKITTWFEKDGQTINTIKAGEKILMKVKVEVNADAQFVMLQLPIPAGCIYAAKKQDWRTYREFYKDKMVLFTEALNKGIHYFDIELEPRYKGRYTLNPAKAELMYFPVFYGRNEMMEIKIVE